MEVHWSCGVAHPAVDNPEGKKKHYEQTGA